MTVPSPCDIKRLYDTEFEAEIAASKVGHKLGSEMIHYKCGSHWHIANLEIKNRSRFRKHHQSWCGVCEVYMRQKNYSKHITLRGHLKKVRESTVGKQLNIPELPQQSSASG